MDNKIIDKKENPGIKPPASTFTGNDVGRSMQSVCFWLFSLIG